MRVELVAEQDVLGAAEIQQRISKLRKELESHEHAAISAAAGMLLSVVRGTAPTVPVGPFTRRQPKPEGIRVGGDEPKFILSATEPPPGFEPVEGSPGLFRKVGQRAAETVETRVTGGGGRDNVQPEVVIDNSDDDERAYYRELLKAINHNPEAMAVLDKQMWREVTVADRIREVLDADR